MCRISGDKQGVFAILETRRQLDLVNFHQDVSVISEFTQQDGGKKRTLECDKRDGAITFVFCREFT